MAEQLNKNFGSVITLEETDNVPVMQGNQESKENEEIK